MNKINLLKAIIKYSFEYDTAYIANGWGNIISVIFYMISNIIFIDVIFRNISTLAGYTRDEVLLFNLLSQVWALLLMNIIFHNLDIFSESVNSGELDLILTKPVPSLFYILFREISIVNAIRDFIPAALILILAINWSNLTILPINLLFGIIVQIAGLICSICINFLVTLPVFWIGDNSGLPELSLEIEDRSGHENFVYEAWNNFWRKFFTFIFPTAVSTALATSVILGKSPAVETAFISIFIAAIFIFLINILWNIAIKNYTSASS